MQERIPKPFRERLERFHSERWMRDWGGRSIFAGRRPGPDAIVVNSNDYLSLGREPELIGAMARALREQGADTLMSGALLADDHPVRRLESDLAELMGATAGILCPSGFAANAGLLQLVCDQHTPVYIDLLAHMSLWEGARRSGAPLRPFRHNDVGRLRRSIAEHGPGVVVVDTVYSSDGSVCPLPELVEAARQGDCLLVADESHSLGVRGPGGAGLTAELGLGDGVHFLTASLSKAFAGRAGFVACPEEGFPEFFRLEAYPAVFSSTLLSHDIAGLRAALDLVRGGSWRRRRLAEVSARVRSGLRAAGIPLHGSESQIVSLVGGAERDTMRLRDALEESGVFGAVFCPPAATRRTSFVRLSLHCSLTDAQVERLVTACAAEGGRLRPAPRPPAGP